MRQLLTLGLLWFAAVGCGLIAGVYFGFSSFVMMSLGRLGWVGATSMNAMIVDIVKSPFIPLFILTTLSSAILAGMAMFRLGEPGSVAMLAGGVLYVAGMFIVTMVFNQPMNEALAAVDPATAKGASLWVGYLRDWTFWNNVRTLASTASFVLFIVALKSR